MCLSAAYAVGIIVFGAVAYFDDQQGEGQRADSTRQVVEGKDLVADILPPPEYIIESYLTAFELSD